MHPPFDHERLRAYQEDRCRYFDTARGSGVEGAACPDVLVARHQLAPEVAEQGKGILLGVVSMTAGPLARFAETVGEAEQAPCLVAEQENE